MKIKVFLFFVIITANLPSHSQANKCKFLDAVLEYESAKKVLYFDIHQEVPIVFVDVRHVFSGCPPGNLFGREIKIIDDSSQISEINYSNIVVEYFSQTNKKFILRLFYAKRNAFVIIEAKRKKNKVKIKKFSAGYF
jgi:hypothetical protein